MRQALFLVKGGVPFDVAMSLDAVELQAWTIMFSEFEGNEFDWHMYRFRERK